MNTAPISYNDLVKQAQAYLEQKKRASADRAEGDGLPAEDIADPTKKQKQEPSDIRFTDAKAKNQNLPEGEGTKTKDQPENASASGALEGNRGNAPSGDKKEPAVSTDDVMTANKREGGETSKSAQEVAKMAVEILKSLSSVSAGEKKAEDTVSHEKTETPAVEKKEEAAEAAVEKKEEAKKDDDKSASELPELTRDLYAKIGMAVLQSDEGKAVAERVLTKQAGAEAARAVLMFNDEVAKEAAEFQKAAAAYQAGQAACDQLIANIQAQGAEKAAGAPVKSAADFHISIMNEFKTDAEKSAYALGAEVMRKIAEGEPVDLEGGADAGEAVEGAEGAGEAGGQDVTIEDIAAALQQLIQSGEITPEVAEEVLQKILGGGEGAGAEGVAPEAAGAIPPEAGMEAQASVQDLGKKAAAAIANRK
jgi:hypothetical protein